jgi:hypothetical protein
VQEPIDTERISTLAEAAKVAPLHLLRVRAGADIERRIVADLIATAMEGGPAGPEVLSELGLLGRTLVVVALGVLNARTDGEPRLRRPQTEDRRCVGTAHVGCCARVSGRSAR